jgi:hypothetical protein
VLASPCREQTTFQNVIRVATHKAGQHTSKALSNISSRSRSSSS